MKKTLGILGGLGPLATADLFRKIVVGTVASCDNDHIHIFIDNNVNIPDRTKALKGECESPVEEMVKSAKTLVAAGADILIMPCNTAHAFYGQILERVNIPFIHMIEETAKTLNEKSVKKVGLLATDGTILSGVYKNTLDKYGIETILPDAEHQKAVMELIYSGVKAGRKDFNTDAFMETVAQLKDKGADLFVLGCTELPVAVNMYKLDIPAIDPTMVLAKSAILAAGYQTNIVI